MIPHDVALSLLAHELRAPLGVVRGYLRLLDQGGGLDERQQKAVDGGSAGGDRMAALLDQASELARLLRGETIVEGRPVDVASLLEAAAAAAVLPSDPPVSLDITAPLGLAISGDPIRLVRALGAIITALARTSATPTTIELSAAAHAEPLDRISVRVAPPGSAGADAVEPNYGRGGQGLELVLAGAVIDAHDGRLEELQRDQRLHGFTVWLPRHG